MRPIAKLFLPFVLAAAAAQAVPRSSNVALRIELRNLVPGRGQVLLGVCREAQYLTPHCAFRTIVPVTSEPQVVAVPASRLPRGRYGVQVVYDRNSNGKLDSNLLGIPDEPVGFSNDAAGRFGPPRFEQTAIEYAGITLELTIHVR